MRGFNAIVPQDLIQIFDVGEMELLLGGVPEISVDEWRRETVYQGYHATSPAVEWFWEAVRSMSLEQQARLLQFVTGMSLLIRFGCQEHTHTHHPPLPPQGTSRVPSNGFSALIGSNGVQRFTIARRGKAEELPRAHTCFNRIDLPAYTSYQELRKKLMMAVELSDGFGGVD